MQKERVIQENWEINPFLERPASFVKANKQTNKFHSWGTPSVTLVSISSVHITLSLLQLIPKRRGGIWHVESLNLWSIQLWESKIKTLHLL